MASENRQDIPTLQKAADDNPDDVRAQVRLGTALAKAGFTQRAGEVLRRATDLDPKCLEAWVNLGGVLLAVWDFAGCVEANQKAACCNPKLVAPHFNEGLGHLYMGNALEVVRCFEKVVELEPENGAGMYHLAAGLCALDRDQEAERTLQRAMALGYSPQADLMKELERKRKLREEKIRTGAEPLAVIEMGPDGGPGQED